MQALPLPGKMATMKCAPVQPLPFPECVCGVCPGLKCLHWSEVDLPWLEMSGMEKKRESQKHYFSAGLSVN